MIKEDIDFIVASDVAEEYKHAVSRAEVYARENDRLVWVYASSGFLRITNKYQKQKIAKCYPGGRIELGLGVVL